MSEIIRFNRVDGAYGCFANASSHIVYVDRHYWPTTEHYFQTQKFSIFEYRDQILTAATPAIAVKLGQNPAWAIRPDWDEIKVEVMRTAVLAKVMQHADVRGTLLSTGDAPLLFHTRRDDFWGDGGDGQGQNILGKILMEIRADLIKDGPYDELKAVLPPLWVKFPNKSRFSMFWRMDAGEDYTCTWVAWFGGLSDEGKQRYQDLFPEPPGWKWYYQDEIDWEGDREGIEAAAEGEEADFRAWLEAQEAGQ